MIELRHFSVGVHLKVHCGDETGNVLVAGLVLRGERVEESCPGGVEGHDGVFLSFTSATRWVMTRRHGGNNNNDKRPSPRGFETKFVATPLQSSSHETWRGGRFLSVPSPSYCLQIKWDFFFVDLLHQFSLEAKQNYQFPATGLPVEVKRTVASCNLQCNNKIVIALWIFNGVLLM